MFKSLYAVVCVSAWCDLIRDAGFSHRFGTASHRLLLHPEILQSRIQVNNPKHHLQYDNVQCHVAIHEQNSVFSIFTKVIVRHSVMCIVNRKFKKYRDV